MTQQFKMENGKLLPLTKVEQAEYDALQSAWPTTQSDVLAKAALPDNETIIAHLVDFAVNGTPLPSDVIEVASIKLSAINLKAIAIK